MESRLAQLAPLPQKDKAAGYQALLNELLTREDQTGLDRDIHLLVENVLQESVGLVIGRLVLTELVKALSEGRIQNTQLRKTIVKDVLELIQPRIVTYEEQVSMRSHSEDAVAPMRIPSGQYFEVPTGGYL